MKAFVVVALVAALSAFAFVPTAPALGCVVGNDVEDCTVSVTTVYCVTEPCDGVVVCVGHGKVCSNRVLP